MGTYIPQFGFGSQLLQQVAAAPPAASPAATEGAGKLPTLAALGKELKAERIAELRDDVVISDAVKKLKKDKLDQVFFEAEGKRYVAFGKGMNISRLLEKKVHDTKGQPVEIAFGSVKGRVLEVDDETNTTSEAIFGTIKRYGIWTGAKIGIVAGGAVIGALGLGYFSKAVTGIIHTAKELTVGLFRSIAGRIGTTVPVAGLIVAGTMLVGEAAYTAYKVKHAKPDYAPTLALIKE